MKNIIVAGLVLMLTPVLLGISFGECEPAAFVEEVNAAWVTTNYPLIKQAITNRLAVCTNDILAKGLYFEYYFLIETDYALGQEKAAEFVTAVSNRVPDEVIEKREPLGLPIAILQMTTPSNYPVSVPERMAYLHQAYPNSFPHIALYQILAGRVEAIENGTFTWEGGFTDEEGE